MAMPVVLVDRTRLASILSDRTRVSATTGIIWRTQLSLSVPIAPVRLACNLCMLCCYLDPFQHINYRSRKGVFSDVITFEHRFDVVWSERSFLQAVNQHRFCWRRLMHYGDCGCRLPSVFSCSLDPLIIIQFSVILYHQYTSHSRRSFFCCWLRFLPHDACHIQRIARYLLWSVYSSVCRSCASFIETIECIIT